MSMKTPTVPSARHASNTTRLGQNEVQRIILIGNAPPAPAPPDPPMPPSAPAVATPSPFSPPADPSSPPPPPVPPVPPPSPDTPLAGQLLVEFNGETLDADEALDAQQLAQYALGYVENRDATDAALLFKGALEQLSVISVVGVTASAILNTSSATPQVSLIFDVAFHHGDLVPSPLNLGPMPLTQLNVDGVAGANSYWTEVITRGSAPPNMSFPEQVITVSAPDETFVALTGALTLSFKNATTAPLLPNASATAVRVALQALPTVGEIEVIREELSDKGSGAFAGVAWTVRFYAAGSPSHIGPQPSLVVDASGISLPWSSRRRSLAEGSGFTIGVSTASEGTSPFDPTDASDEAASAMTADVVISTNATLEAEVIGYVVPVHICGDGIRTTAEACDDNNTAGGDGCNAMCRVEVGFKCVSSNAFGSGVGGVDTCAPVCGDGRRVTWSANAEGCDDNNTIAGDGCSPDCAVEAGYSCAGGSFHASDTCSPVCGDGLRVGTESCDDGNKVALDGCAGDCSAIEDGFTCSGGSNASTDTCAPCHESCATCTGTLATDCVTCASSSPFLQPPGSCVASCTPLGKYAESNKQCTACDPTCGTCSGPTSSNCLTCTGSATPFLSAGTCVAECADDEFGATIGSGAVCTSCHASCQTCSGGGSMACLSCPSSVTPYSDGGACVAACPSGKYANADNHCVACETTCSACTNGTASDCTACKAGGVHDAGLGTCEYVCAPGSYLTNGVNCTVCDATCDSCDGDSSADCLSCDVSSSHPAQYGRSCLSVCPDGTYADPSLHCVSCNSVCATCSGGSSSDCVTCSAGAPFKSGTTCVAACPSREYANAGSECASCDPTCAECSGPNASSCTACPAHAPFLHGGQCLATCPSTHYASSASACSECDASCSTCGGLLSTDCLTCPVATPHLVGGACTCKVGYLATSDACTQIDECSTGGHNCFDVGYCTDTAGSFECACPPGYSGDGVTCDDIDECALGTHVCSADARCINTAGAYDATKGGSYDCTCSRAGYWGDGIQCGDVNECTMLEALPTTAMPDCHENADCINLDGRFDCTCKDGFIGTFEICDFCHDNIACHPYPPPPPSSPPPSPTPPPPSPPPSLTRRRRRRRRRGRPQPHHRPSTHASARAQASSSVVRRSSTATWAAPALWPRRVQRPVGRASAT